MKYNVWNKYFWGALAAVGLLVVVKSCEPVPASAFEVEQLPEITQQILLPTVRIDNNCTGTVIDTEDKIVVLTAKHCMNNDVKVGERHNVTYLITVDNGVVAEITFPLFVSRIAPGDMVLLEGDVDTNLNFQSASVVTQDDLPKLDFGMKVYCVSFGAARSPVFTEGYLGYVENLEGFGDVQRATCPTIGGSSGSGLFVLIDGNFKLIGTLTGGWGESFNFYSPAYQLLQFLNGPTPTSENDPLLDRKAYENV